MPATANAKPWQLIGEKTVDAARDKETITLDGRGGRFDELRLVDAEMDVEVVGVVVTLGNGDVFVPNVHERQLGIGESVGFALPGGAHAIRSIRLDLAVVGEAFGAGPWGRVKVFAQPARDRAYGKSDPIVRAAVATHALVRVRVEHLDGSVVVVAPAALLGLRMPVRAVATEYVARR